VLMPLAIHEILFIFHAQQLVDLIVGDMDARNLPEHSRKINKIRRWRSVILHFICAHF
jgi:hypothetical protein